MIEKDFFSVSPLIGDHAVLQRNEILVVQGGGRMGAEVSGVLEQESGQGETEQSQTTVGVDGTWHLEFLPRDAGGPYRFRFCSENKTLCFSDVYIGDVWVLSGQSNMQLPMERIKYRFPEEYKKGSSAVMRQFTVPIGWDFEKEAKEVEGGTWEMPSGDFASRFSAAGFFFAQALYNRYRIPIGLILTAVGGTTIQAWMSRNALSSFPEELILADTCRAPGYVDHIRNRDFKRTDAWWKQLEKQDAGVREHWEISSRVAAEPEGTISLEEDWKDDPGLAGSGSVWLEKWIEIGPEWAGKPVRLSLGTITDTDFVYVNGRLAGSTGYRYPPREYELSGLPAGCNRIVIRVVVWKGQGGFTRGKAHRLVFQNPAGIQDISDGWNYRRGAVMEVLEEPVFFERKPLGMYQRMMAPLHALPIKGICWYQGESNADQYQAYPGYFKNMVETWREKWKKPYLPVLFVQLPCYGLWDSVNWVAFRHMQQGLAALPNTAMVVTIDCGEWNDLHPTDKKTVGERLAMAARHVAYKEKETWLSPIFSYGEVREATAILHFKYAEDGIYTRENQEVCGMELGYGKDGAWEWKEPVNGAWIDGSTLAVPLISRNGQDPSAVLYAWSNHPDRANLCNRYELPVSPFLYRLTKKEW